MRQIRTSAAAAIAGLAVLALLATPSFAGGKHGAMNAGAPVQTTHMGQGQGGAQTGQPCPMGMTGPGKMAPGMSGQGMMGPGTGGQGMMGPGMMGPGTGGQGMMGPGFGKDPGLGTQVVPSTDLTADDVRHFLEHGLEMHGNKRLKVSEVKEADDDKIVADITTVDGSLVQRLEVDRHTRQMRDIE
jgi:hypothetical protein